VLDRGHGCLRAVDRTGPFQNARDVRTHGALGDPHAGCDLRVVETLDDQLQHLTLPRGQ
jgi:hypothetical protein